MFLGAYEPRLDDKSRLVPPAKFRDQLAEGLVITKGRERCLCVWPIPKPKAVTDRLSRVPVSSQSARGSTRVLSAGASDGAGGKVSHTQGRVPVSLTPQEYAGPRCDRTVIRVASRVEVWDGAAWRRGLQAGNETLAELSREVLSGLL